MNKNKLFDFYAPIFYPAIIVVAVFILTALVMGAEFEVYLPLMNHLICDNFGWLIVLSANFFLGFCLFCAFGRFGKIKIGGKHAEPDFSDFSWFSMLFTVGVSTGILFFGVAEPITHFANPPIDLDGEAAAAAHAMKLTFLNFGLHGWAMYLVVGLAVAFFTFNRNMPLKISSAFQPILGERINGFLGHFIDIATLVANLFGVALSLLLSTQLISNGLNRIVGLPDNFIVQLFIITIITLIATISVVLGLQKGIKVLSNLNVRIALLLLLFMLFLGPTVFILDSFVQNTGGYLQNLIELGTWTEAYLPQKWQNDYTVFYWIWYAAWAPFTGIFIARISRGRTIRQFVLMGLFAPCLMVFLWKSVFGGAAIYLEMQGIGNLSEMVQDNPAAGFFGMLSHYPLADFTSIAFLLLASLFFITSSDSASTVNDYLSSGGKLETPKGQKIFWGVTEGVLAILFLSIGGLGVINGAITLFGFIFMLVLLVMPWSLYKALNSELKPKE